MVAVARCACLRSTLCSLLGQVVKERERERAVGFAIAPVAAGCYLMIFTVKTKGRPSLSLTSAFCEVRGHLRAGPCIVGSPQPPSGSATIFPTPACVARS